jgi:hypothetical protein
MLCLTRLPKCCVSPWIVDSPSVSRVQRLLVLVASAFLDPHTTYLKARADAHGAWTVREDRARWATSLQPSRRRTTRGAGRWTQITTCRGASGSITCCGTVSRMRLPRRRTRRRSKSGAHSKSPRQTSRATASCGSCTHRGCSVQQSSEIPCRRSRSYASNRLGATKACGSAAAWPSTKPPD